MRSHKQLEERLCGSLRHWRGPKTPETLYSSLGASLSLLKAWKTGSIRVDCGNKEQTAIQKQRRRANCKRTRQHDYSMRRQVCACEQGCADLRPRLCSYTLTSVNQRLTPIWLCTCTHFAQRIYITNISISAEERGDGVSYKKRFVHLWETVFREPESVLKQKNHFVTLKRNLINMQFNLPPWSLQKYLKMFYTTNL